MMKTTLACLLFFTVCYAEKPVSRILDELTSYDPNKRPSGLNRQDAAVEVTVSMYFLDVNTVDNCDRGFTCQVYFRQGWYDPRLKSRFSDEPVKFLNLKDLSRIWKPDLFFIEELEGRHLDITTPNTFIKWQSNGTLFYSNRYSLNIKCDMNLRYYPHDEQLCPLNIESFVYTASEMKLTWVPEDNAVMAADNIDDPNFEIIDVSHHTAEEVVLSGNKYTRLTVNIAFKRKIGFFLTNLYIPYILLGVISILSLWISPQNAKLRFLLLFSVLTIMFVLLSLINKYTPYVSYVKAIDVWSAFNISFVFALFLEFCFIIQSDRRNKVTSDAAVDGATDLELASKSEKEETAESNFFPLKPQRIQQSLNAAYRRVLNKTDYVSRFFFPALYVIFNVLYWSICYS